MVRPAVQEGTWCATEGAVAAIYPASSSGGVAAPHALMEFAGLPVLITLSVSTKLAGKFFRFTGRQDWPFMPSP